MLESQNHLDESFADNEPLFLVQALAFRIMANIMSNTPSVNKHNLLNERTMLLFCFEVAFNKYIKSCKQGILQKTSLARSINRDQSMRPRGHKPSNILHP